MSSILQAHELFVGRLIHFPFFGFFFINFIIIVFYITGKPIIVFIPLPMCIIRKGKHRVCGNLISKIGAELSGKPLTTAYCDQIVEKWI